MQQHILISGLNSFFKYKYKTKHANLTMKNMQIQVGVMETIILFVKTSLPAILSLYQLTYMYTLHYITFALLSVSGTD